MQGELGIVVYVDLERVPHELLADGADVEAHGGREHHHLLQMRSHFEDGLDVLPHV